MAVVKAFNCIRPNEKAVKDVAALPYDVYDRKEAKEAVKGKPLSFLNIDRPETQFPDDFDMYSEEAYEKAKELLDKEIADGTFLREPVPCYYVYEQTVEGGELAPIMKGHSQTGIAACSSVDEYQNGIIKKHENTRADKEKDRIHHVDTCNAQTGPIFLAYRSSRELNRLTDDIKKDAPLYDFVSDDGIRHKIWRVSEPETTSAIENAFKEVPATYIADGHHRAASAVKVALKRREEHPDYTGKEEYNYFLSVLFPDSELKILPYNRAVRDLNGLTEQEFIDKINKAYTVKNCGENAVVPEEKGKCGMYLDHTWYELTAKDSVKSQDPVKGLDVSVLQDHVLMPLLGIEDPRTDKRISFIGGIRGTKELEKLVDREGYKAAFSMFPTGMQELLSVADAKLLMPPKSTWFEPKLMSGIFIHQIG